VIAGSPLVFPSPEAIANLHTARVFNSDDEVDEWERLWSPFIASG
jgi:hypothetical protein